MIESTAQAHSRREVDGILIQSNDDLHVILWFHSMTQQETHQIEKLHLQIEFEILRILSNLGEAESVFRLKLFVIFYFHF